MREREREIGERERNELKERGSKIPKREEWSVKCHEGDTVRENEIGESVRQRKRERERERVTVS